MLSLLVVCPPAILASCIFLHLRKKNPESKAFYLYALASFGVFLGILNMMTLAVLDLLFAHSGNLFDASLFSVRLSWCYLALSFVFAIIVPVIAHALLSVIQIELTVRREEKEAPSHDA